MASIFENSSPVIRSEVDFFQVMPTDASIEKSLYIEYSPTTNVQENSTQIEFVIPESSNFYRDLQKSFMYIVCQVVNEDNSKLPPEVIPQPEYQYNESAKTITLKPYKEPDHLVAPVNNIGHSLFSQCDCFINDVMVSQTNNLYAYRGIIEAMLNYGSEYKNCQGGLSLYSQEVDPHTFQTKIEDGFKKRYEAIKESKMLELISKPCADIFHLPKYLLSGTCIKLKFTRSTNEFCLLQPSTSAKKFKIKIHSASLFVLSHQLYPSLRVAHEKLLSQNNTAKFSFRRVEMKTFLVPSGNKSVSKENLFYGQVPLRIVVAFVNNAAVIGSSNLNPFAFDNFDISYFSVLVDDEQICFKPLKLDFENNQSLLCFYTLLTSSGVAHQDLGIGINRDDYINSSKALFAFNLCPLADDDVFSIHKTGNIRFDIQFKKPLAKAVSVIVYAEFNSMLEIDKERQVRLNF
ncbi:hypothetical protein Fcan01_24897 [Folsomia candida]|uniref:Uncharacterized protein n=1 Tax=Folsomia candida TaxID=158441 RepID=A0A226D4J1_FOLCA|nr:hypothetical protein Fcan01_24897 [Folsomia candida]